MGGKKGAIVAKQTTQGTNILYAVWEMGLLKPLMTPQYIKLVTHFMYTILEHSRCPSNTMSNFTFDA